MGQETLGLGQIITSKQERDAIHIAVLPVAASERLNPGDWVALDADGRAYEDEDGIGVVDPFLKTGIRIGQMFWLYLIPGSITSLRHSWTHPALDSPKTIPDPDFATSEKWLRNFISRADCPGYETTIAAAIGDPPPADDDGYNEYSTSNDGEYLTFIGRDAHGDIPPEFWDHVEVVTGRKIPPRHRAQFFGCSC